MTGAVYPTHGPPATARCNADGAHSSCSSGEVSYLTGGGDAPVRMQRKAYDVVIVLHEKALQHVQHGGRLQLRRIRRSDGDRGHIGRTIMVRRH
jgi:hypothetical protein